MIRNILISHRLSYHNIIDNLEFLTSTSSSNFMKIPWEIRVFLIVMDKSQRAYKKWYLHFKTVFFYLVVFIYIKNSGSN